MRIVKLAICVLFLNYIFTGLVFSAPSQIIIIRHADKLFQSETGPLLSARGQVRAIKFAYYFLAKYGTPDYLFAANPVNAQGKNSSLRPLLTLAPLANIIQKKNPKNDVPIFHPYEESEYANLATHILEDKRYHNKLVLICWSHGKIPDLAAQLGVTQVVPDWESNDYDTVYVLKYNATGKLINFKLLNKQYPVAFKGTWKDILVAIST